MKVDILTLKESNMKATWFNGDTEMDHKHSWFPVYPAGVAGIEMEPVSVVRISVQLAEKMAVRPLGRNMICSLDAYKPRN